MRVSRSVALVLAACGSDHAIPDAAGTVAVHVDTPNGGEQAFAAEPVAVQWTGTDPAGGMLTYDVVVVDGTGMTTDVARGLALPAGAQGSASWTPIGVPAPTPYRIRVTAMNEDGESAVDESDADVTVSPPAQGVSFAAHLQPIFTAHCTAMFCHNTQWQTAVLDLSPGMAYGFLVGIASREQPCTSYLRVAPGDPDRSYLVYKLEGTGPCFTGVPMPKSAPPLAAAEIAMIREWIASGAKNN